MVSPPPLSMGVIIHLQVYCTDMDDLSQIKNMLDTMITAKGLGVGSAQQ
jgi:hypothetical protein